MWNQGKLGAGRTNFKSKRRQQGSRQQLPSHGAAGQIAKLAAEQSRFLQSCRKGRG